MSVFSSPTTVQLALDRHDFHPGDSVNVRVAVGGQPDERVQGGRVELAYVNRYLDRERDHDFDDDGPDQTRTVTRSETVVAAWQPMVAAPNGPVAFGEQSYTLTFPPDAPPTAHEPAGFGDVVRWEVRGILDRKMAFDPDAAQPVTVRSRPGQYAHWAQSPPLPKSAECPMGLNLSTRVLRPGEPVSGTLTISPRDSFKGRAIRAQLERRRTDRPDDLQRTETLAGVQVAGETELQAGQTLSFPFEVYLDQGVPPTFNAAKNHLHWFVEGVVDRKLRSDYVVEAEIVVYTGHGGAPGQAPPAGRQPGTPPGWYADPWRQARLRYWDGNAWTGQTNN
jgi:sporulation-control protein spo0M